MVFALHTLERGASKGWCRGEQGRGVLFPGVTGNRCQLPLRVGPTLHAVGQKNMKMDICPNYPQQNMEESRTEQFGVLVKVFL